jgi:hypothetical protein
MLMALVMAVGLYKNRQRAREVFIQMIQVEGLIAVEVRGLFYQPSFALVTAVFLGGPRDLGHLRRLQLEPTVVTMPFDFQLVE